MYKYTRLQCEIAIARNGQAIHLLCLWQSYHGDNFVVKSMLPATMPGEAKPTLDLCPANFTSVNSVANFF